MDWKIVYDSLVAAALGAYAGWCLGQIVLLSSSRRQARRKQEECQEFLDEHKDFINFLDNVLLVLRSDEDESTKDAMALYLHEQWQARPSRMKERE